MKDLSYLFKEVLKPSQILINEPMKNHTSFKIGGLADIVILPENIEEIKNCIGICEENSLKYFVMGNGTNLLVRDKGFRGVIIKFLKNFNEIKVKGESVIASSGALLVNIAKKAAEHSLEGIEFAVGIPGTVGGGVCMNAGAYGGEIKDVLEEVVILNKGKVEVFSNLDCEFQYRNSKILKENIIVLEAKFSLKKGEKEDILEKMKKTINTRNENQPIEYPSAGSTFKRPLNNFAGKLIMESNLSGENVGDAYVSEKHCGFIINKGEATCADVLKLCDIICDKVKQKFNIDLEKEVRVIGEN